MIGDRIKQARLALGQSAEQVAAHLGVSPATIYRYENGDIAKLPSKHIKPLAEFLCVSPSYLMDWSDEQEENHPLNLQVFNNTVSSSEARIISGGVDRMPPEKREQALKILQVAFAEFFKEGTDNDA